MVTHDVALKNFANRVVRMVDGKVQSITENPPEERQKHIDNLKKIIEGYMTDDKTHGALGVRAGNNITIIF